VGVDYSLFYMRRERDERRAGRGPMAALEAATATVGHAVVVSGMSVIVAMAGLLLTGSAVFTAIAIGTMLVVAAAVLGSVTVLPALLAMLGDRVYRGRLWRPRPGSSKHRIFAWGALANAVVARPRIALLTVVVMLGSLALGALQLHTSDAGLSDLPPGSPVLNAQRVIERAFPGGSSMAQIVLSGGRSAFSGPHERATLEALGGQAIRDTAASGTAGCWSRAMGVSPSSRYRCPAAGSTRARWRHSPCCAAACCRMPDGRSRARGSTSPGRRQQAMTLPRSCAAALRG
jgi:hypothetical protein